MNNQSSDSDLIALLDRVGGGDEGALKALYDQTASRLYGLALRILSQREWAEDALQETFLSIWRSAADYRATLSPPMAWLSLIVRSRALDIYRRRKSEGSQLTQELNDELTHNLESDVPGPADMAESGQQSKALHGCLQRLESQQREVLSLAYLRDLSHGELAQQLGLPLGTVKTWIRRGLEQLRLCMARFV